MASVYQRGQKYWGRVKGSDGKWRSVALDVRVDEPNAKKKAKRRVESAQREADKKREAGGPITLSRYADKWLETRKGYTRAHANEKNWLGHILAMRLQGRRIGDLQLEELRPSTVRDLFLQIRAMKDESGDDRFAPRTIHSMYGALRRMMRSAQIEELIEGNPVVVDKGVLPKARDKDPRWRASAVFTRDELEALISDERIPLSRRTFYALMGLGGLRTGEALRARWEDYEREVEPLGRLFVWQTKTEAPRAVPVHPTLAGILAEWKLASGASAGRILPEIRSSHTIYRQRARDLQMLGLRHRRGHDLRATFISLARQDGARGDLLERVTHSGRSTVFESYSRYDWPALCAEVERLQVERRVGAKIVPLATALLQSPQTSETAEENDPRIHVSSLRCHLGLP